MSMDESLKAIVRAAVADAFASAKPAHVEPEPLYDTKKIAKYLSVSERTVQTLRESGLPCRRVGDCWRYDRAEVDAWSREQARKSE